DMNDPARIVGRIPACSSEANRSTAMRLMREAVADLAAAYEHEKSRNETGYWTRMARVFGDNYPWPHW
ncbi:MAG: hypothetical protein M3450_09555, partial [Actinomycetota bacterium]|nr:hypothetical protein [Actinomycetota bacterium]